MAGEPRTRQGEAIRMLDTFVSVGATSFDMTVTSLLEEKRRFRRHQPLDLLRNVMPGVVGGAEMVQHNVIVRPRGEGVTFVQLDDLDAASIEHLKPAAFLCLQPSPGNN